MDNLTKILTAQSAHRNYAVLLKAMKTESVVCALPAIGAVIAICVSKQFSAMRAAMEAKLNDHAGNHHDDAEKNNHNVLSSEKRHQKTDQEKGVPEDACVLTCHVASNSVLCFIDCIIFQIWMQSIEKSA